MNPVAVVTDSTANIPPDLAEQAHIHVAPQTVIWDHQTYRDGIDISTAEFYQRLSISKTIPTTSQVTPGAFQEIFQGLLDQGFDVLAVLISHKLSGTMLSAEQAEQLYHTDRLAVVDSTSVSIGLGYLALLAARAANQGASLAECRALVEKAIPNTDVLFVLETLKYLHLGGRIGGATRFLGTALDLKPILEIADGQVEAIERVRSKRKAIDRTLDIAEQRIAGRHPLHLGILHAGVLEEAKTLQTRACERFHPVECIITEISPVVGVHAGPGALGLAFVAGV